NQAGNGTVILTGANSYGATLISAGALQVGNGGSTGTLGAGNVIDNTSLIFNHSDTIAVPNAISGTGTLTQAGAGTLILTGANTYAGTTTISAGTFQIGQDGVPDSLSAVRGTDSATSIFNRRDFGTYANIV